MIRLPAGFTVRALLAALCFIGAAGVSAGALPPSAHAYATIEGPPIFSTAPGLPDGRVYEQVSPADKNGNEAGASTGSFEDSTAGKHWGRAAPDGNSVYFQGTGPLGETASATSSDFVATRSAAGWSTRSVLPAPRQPASEVGTLEGQVQYLVLSPDLSHALIQTGGLQTFTGETSCGDEIYLTGPSPFVAATWLERPEISNPVADCPEYSANAGVPVGGSTNFSTVYFSYAGTLLPEDAGRAPHTKRDRRELPETLGFYEYSEGVLREAGVLPDGGLDPFGAVSAPAGNAVSTDGLRSSLFRAFFISPAVSTDGSRAFFISPDPASCSGTGIGENNCAVDPPELYVRENGSKTLLVSRDTLLPEVGGLPAPAPADLEGSPGSYALASPGGSLAFSPDGSQAFFQSEDDLTGPAEEASPGSEPKTYDFDVNTGSLTYLPNVVGQIVATDTDGSSFAFVRPAAGASPREIDLWSAGAAGGSVTPIAQLPGAASVEPVRMSSHGSVVLFSAAGLPGFNDGSAEEIFRYDAPANTLGCVSCAPAGVTSTGASIEDGGISSDGRRVFFVTRDPLVPQATNTDSPRIVFENGESEAQGLNVYEWENGVVYLLSSGKSLRNSFLLGNSESGGDVFFATTDGLVPGDVDGGYDVYDPRVPRPGDNPPPAAVPCEGSVCQGPPRVPSPLAASASATFSGLGNTAPEPAPAPSVKLKPRSRPARCQRDYVKRKTKCVKSRAKKSTHGKRSR